MPLARVAEVVDAVNLMAYDFAGPWMAGQGGAGHHARLYAGREPCDAYAKRSGHGAVEYVLSNGVPPRKVVLGVPVYGRSFLGVRGPGERFAGCGGEAGGVVEYRELPREGAEEGEVVDEEVWGASCWVEGGEEGKAAEWVSYDSPKTVREKARYVRERGLGGLFYWTGVADKKGEGSLLRAGYEGLYG